MCVWGGGGMGGGECVLLVLSFIVKHPVLPPCVVDVHSRNPIIIIIIILKGRMVNQNRPT